MDEFGPDILLESGALDRDAMRRRVFADASAKGRLEAILHPLIREQTEVAASMASGPYRIFVVPLLVESGRWLDRVDDSTSFVLGRTSNKFGVDHHVPRARTRSGDKTFSVSRE